MSQRSPASPFDYSSPRPYAWKTDEYPVRNTQDPTTPVAEEETAPLDRANRGYRAAPMLYHQPQDQYGSQMALGSNYAIDSTYHCPRCGSSYLPLIERRVSTAGWIVFSCLLVFTVIFFWVGLLMKENVAVCPVCRARVS